MNQIAILHSLNRIFYTLNVMFSIPQVVNFSSVKKLMQMVKINKVRYTTQPQPTTVVPPFQDFA